MVFIHMHLVIPIYKFLIFVFKKEGMIEVIWKDEKYSEREAMMYLSQLMAWLSNEITMKKEYEDLTISGYIITYEKSTVLIFPDKNTEKQKRILNILQQPPEEFKEKYIACIYAEEPKVVNEKKDTEIDEDSNELSIEIT